ncbi:Threonine dehydratase [Rhodovulum sp. P5]|uniref:threonine dehydratase n=1 Tax=Rhodovulum sp. P5 TaxID=1564506 RepID=UPI0009C261D7|nr:threonine dehydratase [Rhodovulum sp. P5]ARE39073.1 Threonine dehydratase [Rhodovulum sp. P5]
MPEPLFSLEELQAAAAFVHDRMPPTPQYAWPLLGEEVGAKVWVKHENHTPTGAFKVRGAHTFIDWLKRTQPDCPGIVTATRGNHGQGQALAARAAGMVAKVYVPEGNSVEKNAAMRAFGAELIVHGADFDTAREKAHRVAEAEGLVFVPPYHKELVRGVATYALELLTAAPELDTIYVPIGCGSGICGTIAARDALGLATKVVGVVSENADCILRSMAANDLVETDTAHTFADGIATRVPMPEAFEVYSAGAERIIAVSDAEIAEAMRLLFRTTHNVAEGAGAAALAALVAERQMMAGKQVGVILTGGNIDAPWFEQVLSGGVPSL